MSLFDDRQPSKSGSETTPEQKKQSIPSTGQPPNANNPISSQGTTAVLPRKDTEAPDSAASQPSLFPSPVTRQLPEPLTSRSTRVLSDPLSPASETSTKRLPVLIKGEMKKSFFPVVPVTSKHRLYVRLSSLVVLFLILGLTFTFATPLGHDLGWNFNPLQFGSNLIKNPSNGPTGLIAQATATAIYHHQNDGFDPYYINGQVVTDGSYSLNWPAGECTYWANYYYHQLSGYWISWSGNANQWVAGASKAGWVVSQTPRIPSIIVLMPFVQLAGAFGHVAVVDKIINSTTVETSNMNWYANGGGFGRVSYVDFTVGPGVYFIWHP